MYLWCKVVNLCGGSVSGSDMLTLTHLSRLEKNCVAVDARDAHVSNMELHIPPDLGYSCGILLSRSWYDKYF